MAYRSSKSNDLVLLGAGTERNKKINPEKMYLFNVSLITGRIHRSFTEGDDPERLYLRHASTPMIFTDKVFTIPDWLARLMNPRKIVLKSRTIQL